MGLFLVLVLEMCATKAVAQCYACPNNSWAVSMNVSRRGDFSLEWAPKLLG